MKKSVRGENLISHPLQKLCDPSSTTVSLFFLTSSSFYPDEFDVDEVGEESTFLSSPLRAFLNSVIR